MTKLCTVVSAHTSFPNTPESDQCKYVPHDVRVKLPDGVSEIVRLSATDPSGAIREIQGMSDEQFQSLPRVPSDK